MPVNSVSTAKQNLETWKILILGANGLGCEIVKNLAMAGFKNIDIMDKGLVTITGLNSQCLFSENDVGKPKSQTAARAITQRIQNVNITAHVCSIEQQELEFLRGFNLIITTVKSVDSNTWLNSNLLLLCKIDANREPIRDTIIPWITVWAGSFKGIVSTFMPGLSACRMCDIEFWEEPEFPVPISTFVNQPTLPEHHIYYGIYVWSITKSKTVQHYNQTIADDERLDRSNEIHIMWIYEHAFARAKKVGSHGITYRLTKEIISKSFHIAVGTCAFTASLCTNEALKLATLFSPPIDNQFIYANEGIYGYTYSSEKNKRCSECGESPDVTENP